MKIKIKKFHKDAQIPTRATNGSAGWDLYSCHDISIQGDFKQLEYFTGIGVEIPQGYVGLIFPRSSIYKTSCRLSNAVGVIDSDYTGPIRFKFDYNGDPNKIYQMGDRIGQLVIVKYEELEFEEVEELTKTVRGSGGYGSTGA